MKFKMGIFITILVSSLFASQFTLAAAPSGMVLIPAGEFLMGSNPTDGKIGFEVGVDSIPKHPVKLKAFYIDRFEVTVAQYREFINATQHEPPALWNDDAMFGYPPPQDDHPVVDLNFYDAQAYCQWAGKRLPTEAEWEKAARGTDGRIFPWGNTFEITFATTEDRGRHFTTPVGSTKQNVSPYGVYDMAGNAMEWTASLFEPYPGNPRQFAVDKRFRILRGGSWGMPAQPFARTAHRHFRLADLAQPDFGFRCAKDVK